jgi:hypothetical protein
VGQADIHIRPIAGGWLVEGPATFAAVVFTCAEAAALAAIERARAINQVAVDARLCTFDPTGRLVASRWLWGLDSEGPTARFGGATATRPLSHDGL